MVRLNSGELSRIRNRPAREALAELPAMLDDARAVEQIVEDFALGQLKPVLDRSGNLFRPNAFRRFWDDLPPEALQFASRLEELN